MNKTPQILQICLSYQIPFIRWQPSLIIQDGYHSWDPIWPLMLPTTFIKIWSFLNFPSFPMFAIPPSPSHVNYHVREPHVSHTGINVCAHCPLHLPKKMSKKPSVNHIGSSTSHQKALYSNNVQVFYALVAVYLLWLISQCLWRV